MKIAVIGIGKVGSILGRRWSEKGHEIIFGVRDPDSGRIHDFLLGQGKTASAATVPEAVRAGQVVVLATPWQAVEDVIRSAGNLAGKVLIDCTNPLKPDLSGLEVGYNNSAAEKIAGWAKGAAVVKAFNTIGTKNMENPDYGGEKTTLLIAGDQDLAKQTVASLGQQLGFEVVDAGGLIISRYLEPLAMLWIHLAFARGLGADFAIKLLRR